MNLTEEFEDNFIIFSGSRHFKVDKFQLATRMIRFKKDPNFLLSGFYKLITKCEDSIVEKFIEAAKTGKVPDITLDNVPSYQQLSIEFEFNSLFQQCNSFLLKQSKLNEIVSNLLSSDNNSSSKSNYAKLNSIEIALAFNLTKNHISILEKLPNCVLYRILSNPQRPISQDEKSLYEMIKSKIDSGDQEAKFLLPTLKYNTLNHADLSYVMKMSSQLTNKSNSKPDKPNQDQNQYHSQNKNQNQTQKNQNQQRSSQQQSSNTQNQAYVSHSKSLADKVETTQNPPSQSNKPIITRAETIRASSASFPQDKFQSVYIPENSEIRQIERRICEIVNTRRSREYPLTPNIEYSSLMQSTYGGMEDLGPPTESDYLILRDRFRVEFTSHNGLIFADPNENVLYDHVKNEVNQIPLENISNSNFFALTVIKISTGYYCAILIGNAKQGLDPIDSNPPVKQTNSNANLPLPASKNSISEPNLSLDLAKDVKTSFYHKSPSEPDDFHNIFFNKDLSNQLYEFIEKADKEKIFIKPEEVYKNVPALKEFKLYNKVTPNKQTFFDAISQQNKSKNSCIIALATKQFSNGKYACIIAYVDEVFTKEQIDIITTLKAIFKEKENSMSSFNYSLYKNLKEFVKTPKELPEFGSAFDSGITKDNINKFIFFRAPTVDDITKKITSRCRTKISLSLEFTAVIRKLENSDEFQFILVYIPSKQA